MGSCHIPAVTSTIVELLPCSSSCIREIEVPLRGCRQGSEIRYHPTEIPSCLATTLAYHSFASCALSSLFSRGEHGGPWATCNPLSNFRAWTGSGPERPIVKRPSASYKGQGQPGQNTQPAYLQPCARPRFPPHITTHTRLHTYPRDERPANRSRAE